MTLLVLLGRVLFGGYFIRAGFNHFKHLDMMAGYAGSKSVPMPKVAVGATGLMLLLGGLGVLLGVYPKVAVLLLAIFLIGTTYKMHDFWNVTDPMRRSSEGINFYKNIGLLGGVLMLLAIPMPWVLSLF